ncbi:MAG: family transposase, partial [Bacteroidetes bacterium]|nr:family transposase [Bacteroidota bacterium]
MVKFLKQSVGIDCSKDKLDVSFGVLDSELDKSLLSTTVFKNNEQGWQKLWDWSLKLSKKEVKLCFVVEATGVYHEQVSLYLHSKGAHISIMLPNKVKDFMKGLESKSVTDKICAQAMAIMGLEKKLEPWSPPVEIYNILKQLTRERDQLILENSQIKCQIHAERSGAWPNEKSLNRMTARKEFIDAQIREIETEIRSMVKENETLAKKINYVCSIKGIGFITAITVIAETNGFNLIRNKKQLVSYAGLDIKFKDSGTSVHHKPRISRKGNKYIRKAMYLPAMSAFRSDGEMKNVFVRLVSKHGIKMKAAVAVQRKLLELIYTLWKKEEMYDPDYLKKLEQPQE